MTPADLDHLGRFLFGEQWQLPLARALPVNGRTVRRWRSGEAAVSPGAAGAIYDMVAEIQAARALDVISGIAHPVPPIDLWVKPSGNVETLHHRPWSCDADRQILNRVAENIRRRGYDVTVSERV